MLIIEKNPFLLDSLPVYLFKGLHRGAPPKGIILHVCLSVCVSVCMWMEIHKCI